MHCELNPQFIMQYFIQEEVLSTAIRRMFFRSEDGQGVMYLLEVYHGVQLWVIDFKMQALDIAAIDDYRFLKLNYCLAGRCEVQLPDYRYVYMNSGLLSVDLNPPMGKIALPSGKYIGLEILVNLSELPKASPAAWTECGINLGEAKRLLADRQDSYLAYMTREWDRLAHELAEHVRCADLPLEDYRFLLLRLLWLLKTEKQSDKAAHPVFLTPGQRAVIMRVEALLTDDLRSRLTVAELAAQQGVSASSLKKHFTQIFGKPISVYLKERRVERAQELLAGTQMGIADIASEVGYENQGKFGAMFRQETGMTPMEYRRLHHIQMEREEIGREEIIRSKKW